MKCLRNINSYAKTSAINAQKKATVSGLDERSGVPLSAQGGPNFPTCPLFPLHFPARCVTARSGKIPQLFSESVTLVYGAVEFF